MPIYAQSSTLRSLIIPLVDIDQVTLADDQILRYNATSGKFENTSGQTGTGELQIDNNTADWSQFKIFLLYAETADDTPTEMYLNDEGGRIGLTENSTLFFNASIVCRSSDGLQNAGYTLEGIATRDTGNTSIVNVVNETVVGETTEEWYVTVTTEGSALKFSVGGSAATDVRWVGKIETTIVVS